MRLKNVFSPAHLLCSLLRYRQLVMDNQARATYAKRCGIISRQ